ncbi:MAG TPA: choloylglycine hydrolase family protein [Acidimicrobiales bacterium]
MCTSFRIKATDGTVVVGRTMEFPTAMGTKVTVLPRGYSGAGTGKDGPGKAWTSTYGTVGMDAFGQPGSLTDGMNERGLYASLLYMPGFCDYTPAEGADPSSLMSVIDAVAYVLGVSADVAEAKTAMAAVTVWPYVFGPFGFAPPAHLVLHDASGASAVVEWRDGAIEITDNPIGVACNWPHIDWHLTNLRNYVNLADRNPSPITIEGVALSAMGQGPGMHGLPGDSSSPARFVRATAFTAALRPVATGAELEKTALHILNNFDIPFGLIRENDDPAHDDHTLWSTVANLKDRRYVIRSYDNPVPQAVDLATVDFSTPGAREVPLPDGTFAPLAV